MAQIVLLLVLCCSYPLVEDQDDPPPIIIFDKDLPVMIIPEVVKPKEQNIEESFDITNTPKTYKRLLDLFHRKR